MNSILSYRSQVLESKEISTALNQRLNPEVEARNDSYLMEHCSFYQLHHHT